MVILPDDTGWNMQIMVFPIGKATEVSIRSACVPADTLWRLPRKKAVL